MPIRFTLILLAALLALPSAPPAEAARQPVEEDVQGFLDAQPGRLKAYRDGDQPASEIISGACAYYGISPRVMLALLEASAGLLSDPRPAEAALRRPFGAHGPDGFGAQIDWAARELRAGLGPYERPPTLSFTDGTTITLTLAQAPEGVAVQRFLAPGRGQPEWRAVVERFGRAFEVYFNNELPGAAPPSAQPSAPLVLHRPWAPGTRVIHLAYFDHMFPTVDTGQRGNGYVVNYLGRGSVQYDGHDGHDYYFPDQAIGTFILAAADGVAFASTHRGNGVWIKHANGYVTVYWHLDKFAKKFRGLVNTGRGVPVRAGDLLGSSGRSGFVGGTPHLHFEVRRDGRQVDPYGWYGDGEDPCAAYAACAPGPWLWSPELIGEFDFTPPGVRAPDRTPPLATMTIAPRPNLLFLARLDGHALQSVGAGTPTLEGAIAFPEGRFGKGARVGPGDRLAYPSAGNLSLAAGTISLWARLPAAYPPTRLGRHYLLAASAHPDGAPVYTGTLALRREALPDGARWSFWTTPASGEAGRDDLTAPDTLGAGLHHIAVTWESASGAKALYLDGVRVASVRGVALPDDVGGTLEIGRFAPGSVHSGVTIDELAIFDRALQPHEVAALATATAPLSAGSAWSSGSEVLIDLNASDDAGGIASVQLGVDGVFGDPHPYADAYWLTAPARPGRYLVQARLFDRAGNSTVVSETLTIGEPPLALGPRARNFFLPLLGPAP